MNNLTKELKDRVLPDFDKPEDVTGILKSDEVILFKDSYVRSIWIYFLFIGTIVVNPPKKYSRERLVKKILVTNKRIIVSYEKISIFGVDTLVKGINFYFDKNDYLADRRWKTIYIKNITIGEGRFFGKYIKFSTVQFSLPGKLKIYTNDAFDIFSKLKEIGINYTS